MIFGIPSYKRPNCQTVSTLLKAGVDKARIVISVQSESDYSEYKKLHDVEVIFKEADCAAGNRNTLLEYAKEPILLLDDDIRSFALYTDGKWKTDTEAALRGIERLFEVARENHSCVFGVSPNTNAIITRARYEYDYDCLLQGTVIGVLDNSVRFDARWKMVEDYEFSLRMIRQNKHVLRGNYYAANKPKNGSNEGGLHDRYKEGQLPHWIRKLHQIYNEFEPNKNFDGGQIRHA